VRELRPALAGQGAEVATVRDLLAAQLGRSQGFLSLSFALLRAGLLVAVFGLGVLTLRAAGERQQLIASLRLLGYRPGQVVVGLAVEAVLGVTVGVVVGLAVAYAVDVPAFDGQMLGRFRPDPATLAAALSLTYVAVLLVSVGSTWRPALRRPAEALRPM